jgi:hypothetical protein
MQGRIIHVFSLNQFSRVSHHLTVKKLAFRPLVAVKDGSDIALKKLQMSSCGADHAVKIFNIYVNRL